MVKNGLYTREKVWYFAFVAASIFFFIFTSNAFAATDFSIISPTTAVGTSTPSRAITLTVTGGAVGNSNASFVLSDEGAGGVFYPSSTVIISANAAMGSLTQFVYIPTSTANGIITLQATATGGITATHMISLSIGAPSVWFEDNLAGSAGSNLVGHVPDIGGAWQQIDSSGDFNNFLNGSGSSYFVGTGHSFGEPFSLSVPSSTANFDFGAIVSNVIGDDGDPALDLFSQNTAGLSGYRLVCVNAQWELLEYPAGRSLLVGGSCLDGSDNIMNFSVRTINDLQYIFVSQNGVQLPGSPAQDSSWTSGYPGMLSEIQAGYSGSTSGNLISSFIGTNADWVSNANIFISPSAVPSNHAGHITLTLTGASTSWAQGVTMFSISGVSGVSKVSQNITSTSTATLVLTTGNATGSLAISDSTSTTSITIESPSLSISPTNGISGSTTTLTLTGTNTVWTQETPSTLFSISGGSGASMSSPTVISDTSATTLLTIGTAGPLVIRDNSTGVTTTFTPANILSFPNANIYESPYTWMSSGTAIIAPTGGAYLKFSVSGTQNIDADVDTSVNNGMTAGSMPTIKVSITDGTGTTSTWVEFPANDSADTEINLASNLNASATYKVTLYMIGGDQGDTPGFDGTTFQTKINALQFDLGATISSVNPSSNTCIFWGDSILTSYYGGESAGGATGTYEGIVDYSQAWPSYIASSTLNCEYGQTGIGSQGWVHPGQGNYPNFPQSWNMFNSSNPISFSSPPTYALIDEGTNDHGQSISAVTSEVTSTLMAMRSTFGTSTRIFVITPYNPTFDDGTGAPRLGILAGFNSYQATSGGDANTFLIDLGTNAQQYALSPWSEDDIHPDIAAHAQIATLISTAIQADFPVISVSTSSFNADTASDSVTLSATNTAWTAGSPGSPLFTLSGGTGASITAQTITGSGSAQLTISAGTAAGTLTITDPSTGVSATITINAAIPSAPQSLGATAGDDQISLTWLAPALTGGSAITQYLLYDRPTGSSTFIEAATTTPSQLNATISNLMNGQSYDFEVIAQNSIGTSTASGIVSATPSVPSFSGGGGNSASGSGNGGYYIPPVVTTTTPASASTTEMTVAQMQSLLVSLGAQLQALEAQEEQASFPYVFTRNLQYGMTGTDVHELQLFLVEEDKGPAAKALAAHGTTNYFGVLTTATLIEFQKSVGVTPHSGFFGPITRGWVRAHAE